MTNEELKKWIERLIHKVNYPAERNRVCKYCKNPFYAHNLRQFCCSDTCYQTNYNERTRPRKQLEKALEKIKAEEESMNELLKQMQKPKNILKRNIELIDKLGIEKETSSFFDKHKLLDLGINFNVYDKCVSFEDSDDSFSLIMQPYCLTLKDDHTIEIKYNKS